jgi:RNA polymerase sigma factor (sigma-70 family)
MAALATPVTTAEVVKAHRDLTAYVFGNFHRKLTYEEARDAAAEALAEADRAATAGADIRDLHQWLRTAAWRNALDAIRRNVGEGHTPRERAVEFTVDDHADRFTHHPDEDFVEAVAGACDADALRAVWVKLNRDEQRALHLRYFDELPVADVLDVLGCSRHHYENLTKRALRKLRDGLVSGEQDRACRSARALVVRGTGKALAPDLATARDAHLDGCLSCRAFARRSQGLMAALPLPALGLADRLVARWHGFAAGASETAQAGETLAGATALAAGAGGAATGGAAVAGSAGALGAVGAAKTLAVVCSAGAVTAGVCLPALTPDRPHREPDAPAERAAAPTPPRPTPAAPHASASAVPTKAPTTRTTTTTRSAGDNAETAARRRASEPDPSVSPFLPEAGDPPQFDAPRRDRPAARDSGAGPATATTFRATDPPADEAPAAPSPSGAPSRSPAPAPVEPKPAATSSPFSQEFTP